MWIWLFFEGEGFFNKNFWNYYNFTMGDSNAKKIIKILITTRELLI